MAIDTVLFDLDGTLLPMDLDVFVKAYMQRVVTLMAPLGYAPKKLLDAIWRGIGAMVKNDGSKTNGEVFWQVMAACQGERVLADKPVLDRFYEEAFGQLQAVCGFQPAAADEPVFPAVAGNPCRPQTAFAHQFDRNLGMHHGPQRG